MLVILCLAGEPSATKLLVFLLKRQEPGPMYECPEPETAGRSCVFSLKLLYWFSSEIRLKKHCPSSCSKLNWDSDDLSGLHKVSPQESSGTWTRSQVLRPCPELTFHAALSSPSLTETTGTLFPSVRPQEVSSPSVLCWPQNKTHIVWCYFWSLLQSGPYTFQDLPPRFPSLQLTVQLHFQTCTWHPFPRLPAVPCQCDLVPPSGSVPSGVSSRKLLLIPHQLRLSVLSCGFP